MKSGDSLSLSGLDCNVIHFISFLHLFICVQVNNVSGSVSLSRSKSLIGSPIHWLIWTSFCAYYQVIVFPVLIKGVFCLKCNYHGIPLLIILGVLTQCWSLLQTGN